MVKVKAVAVIGAGCSGIIAAKVLIEDVFDVISLKYFNIQLIGIHEMQKEAV